MSLEVAKAWAKSTLRPLDAVDEALALFEQAAGFGVQATLLAASELTAAGKPCLARWTGGELLVLYLNARQAESFRIRPLTVKTQIDASTSGLETVDGSLLALSDVRLDGPDPHDGGRPLTGRYRLCADDAQATHIDVESLALRSHFFHAQMQRANTGYSYPLASLVPPECELTFSFKLVLSHAPPPPRGTWAMFLQLVRPRVSGNPNEGCTLASNVAAALFEIQ